MISALKLYPCGRRARAPRSGKAEPTHVDRPFIPPHPHSTSVQTMSAYDSGCQISELNLSQLSRTIQQHTSYRVCDKNQIK